MSTVLAMRSSAHINNNFVDVSIDEDDSLREDLSQPLVGGKGNVFTKCTTVLLPNFTSLSRKGVNGALSLPTRKRFFCKTVWHSILFIVLMTLTAVNIVIHENIKKVILHQHQAFAIVSLLVFLIIYGAIITLEQVRFMKGINYVAAILLALSLGFLIAVEASWHQPTTIYISIVVTLIISLIVSFGALKINIDFTVYINQLIMSTFVFMIAACFVYIIQHLVPNVLIFHIYSGVGFLLSLAYITVDSQLISIKERSKQLPKNEHVLGGIQLFVDVSYLFYYCMGIIGTHVVIAQT
uniref:Protein lifeguard 2 n=1 Tax=Rhabditophanes sp. KR3021 TaxID=114890 RepID=A0AC35TGG5_9BILA